MSHKVTRRSFIAGTVTGAGVTAGACSSMKKPAVSDKGMPLRQLGETGEMVSILAFGAGSRYALVRDENEAEQMIHRAIELGVNYFDNAYDYGEKQESQRRYGRFLCPTYRKQIFLTNKSIQRKYDEYMRQFDESLVNYKTDTVDLMYFHGVDEMKDLDTITGRGGALEAARKLVDQRAVRFIGMSGHRSPDVFIEAIDRIGLDVIMFPINAARELKLQERIIPHAKKNKVAVMAMKPTAQDALIKKGAKPTDLIRYSMGCDVSGVAVGMRSLEVLESCAAVARSFTPMSENEKKVLETLVASAAYDGSLPYLRPGYQDGYRTV